LQVYFSKNGITSSLKQIFLNRVSTVDTSKSVGGDEFLFKDSNLIVLCILGMLFLLHTPAMAVVLPPPADEIQNLGIVTSIDGIGSMTYDSELSWALSNEVLGSNLFEVEVNPDEPNILVPEPEPPLNFLGEVQSYITYSEDTQANMGIISYRKTSEVTTEPLAGAQYNVWNERLITFTGIDAGTLLSSEDMTMYNVGTCIPATLSVCPFACCGDCCFIPAFCSRVETGSDLDMSRVAAYLAGGFRNVNEVGDPYVFPPIPSVDGPALAKYTVQVSEMGQGKPSLGLVSTYLTISESESRFDPLNQQIDPQKDLMQHMEVSELRSIKGDINLFDYQITYESKID